MILGNLRNNIGKLGLYMKLTAQTKGILSSQDSCSPAVGPKCQMPCARCRAGSLPAEFNKLIVEVEHTASGWSHLRRSLCRFFVVLISLRTCVSVL